MQISAPTTPRNGPTVGASLAVDLSWVLTGAVPSHPGPPRPRIAALFEDHPDLAGRIATFWTDGAASCPSTEFLTLVHAGGGLLATSIEEVLHAVGAGVGLDTGRLRLATESPEERATAIGRIERLKADPRLLDRYVALLGETWSDLDEDWQRLGRPRIEEAAEAYRARLGRGASWPELIANACVDEYLPGILEQIAPPQGEVLLLPSAYFGTMLVLDLPGAFVVGAPTLSPAGAVSRETAEVAEQLKAIASPTRLALLSALRSEPGSVGQLAERFGLSQPTMTGHVRQLREAGLVIAETKGSPRLLRVDDEAFRRLLEAIGRVSGAGREDGASRAGQDKQHARTR